MAISNLTTQYISASFQSLMQVSSSGLIYNGLGAQVTNLVLTSVTASFNGLATSASVAATVTTAAQPNITSVGTLTGLTVAGTLTANTYILSSSVTSMTIEFASGSTAFGNSSDDAHTFIGSVTVTGSLVVSGSSTFRNIGPAQFTGSVISTQGFTGSLQGTASIATNVAYSGLTGAVPTWNQNTTGNAATATLAATATNVAYTGLTGAVPTWNQNTTGNAATATNVAYSGLTGTVPTWNQNTTGNAATATSASTATSATTAATASFISSNFISASVAASGFGSINPASASYSITSSYALSASYSISSSYSINASNANNTPYSGLTGAVTIWNQNTTGNADTATTASYIDPTFISASAAASGFGGATVSASYAATASYVLRAVSSSFATLAGTATTAGTATYAGNAGITDQNGVEDTFYVTFVEGTSGYLPLGVDSDSLQYNASTNTLTVTNVAGNATSATTATTASHIAGTNVFGAVGNSTKLNGQADSYYTNASNISSGTISNSYLPAAISVTSVTASFKGNLVGTASNATNVAYSGLTGTVPTWNQNTSGNAATATNVEFSGITSLPAGISVTGVAAVENITDSPATASLLINGTFYSVAASTKVVKILLDEASMPIGTEFTFFAKNLTNPITFNVTPASPDSIISENGYLSMYGTGSAATAKLISTAPAVWALIGSLKA